MNIENIDSIKLNKPKPKYKFWVSIEFTNNTKYEDVVNINTLNYLISNLENKYIRSVRYYNINLKIKNNV